jgi:hypothetical protein
VTGGRRVEDCGRLMGGAHGEYRGESTKKNIYNVQWIVTVIIQVGSSRVVVHGRGCEW